MTCHRYTLCDGKKNKPAKNMRTAILFGVICILFCTYFVTENTDDSEAATSSGKLGTNLNWTLENGTLRITGNGKMIDGNGPWFSDRDSITTVIISEGITNIGANNFFNCNKIRSIIIPNSVTEIGNYAFALCSDLKGINIPNSVKTIGTGAFCECKSLMSISLPNKLVTISAATFEACSELESVSIPDSVINIDESAFYECTKLHSIRMPSNLHNIGQFAFSKSGIYAISLPNCVYSIGYAAFFDCPNLQSVDVAPNGWPYKSINGVLFNHSQGILMKCPDTIEGPYTIPNLVKTIDPGAFANCTKLTSISFPENLKLIKESAFLSCTGLTEITIPSTVTSIESQAFRGCSNLQSISIPANATITGYWTFKDCINLKNLTMPIDLKFNVETFTNVSNLETLTLINGDGECFINKSNYTFSPWYNSRAKFTSVFIEEGVTSLGDYLFYGCGKLSSMTLPTSITNIGANTFTGCQTSVNTIIENEFGTINLGFVSINSLSNNITNVKISRISESEIPEYARNDVKDRCIFDISANGVYRQGTNLTITLKYSLEEEDPSNLVVWHISDSNIEKIPCTYSNGAVTFETNHLSQYAIMYEEPAVNDSKDISIIYYLALFGIVILLGLLFFLKKQSRRAS